MEALAGRDQPQTTPQMLTAPGARRIVGGGEVEARRPEQGVQEPFGLAQREMVDESLTLPDSQPDQPPHLALVSRHPSTCLSTAHRADTKRVTGL